MSKKNIKVIEEFIEDSSIELKPQKLKLEKSPKEKKEYVLTDARKAQFDKARIKRQENIDLKKKTKELENEEYNKVKNELLYKKDEKDKKRQARELLKLKREVEETSSEEEEIVKPKAKPKPKPKSKPKKVEYKSESEISDLTESEDEIPIKRKPKKVLPSPSYDNVRYIRSSMQYF